MNGLLPMLRKEAKEIRRTSRIYVLPAILVFCALSGSVLTYFLPVILKAAATSSSGVTFQVGTQTVADATLEYFSELSQLALFALVIASAGIISGEVRSGALILVVTKPVSRIAFVLAKIAAQTAVVVGSVVVGTLVFAASAYPLYRSLPVARLSAAVGLWLLVAFLFVCVMVLVSSRVRSYPAAAGIGIGIYAVLAIFGSWSPLALHSPAGLLQAGNAILRGDPAALLWPIVSTFIVIALVIAGTLSSFQRTEI